MKSFARFGLMIVALGTAGLLAGCSSYPSAKTARRATGKDFEVVETSMRRGLTDREMAQLRVAVDNYLKKEGVVADGDYYVKVFITEDRAGQPGEWVVVRFTRDANMRFSLLASYPSSYSTGYNAYRPTYAADYYPYDWYGSFSLQYFDDYYYGNRFYYPQPVFYPGYRPTKHEPDRHHGRGPDRDGHGDHPRRPDWNPGSGPTQNRPNPPATPTRWYGKPSYNHQPGQNNPPSRPGDGSRQPDPGTRWHHRDAGGASNPPPRDRAGNRSDSGRSAAPSQPPPARTESRQESSGSRSADSSVRTDSTSSRSDSGSRYGAETSQREANRESAQRARLQ